jgi:hypothetical protein
MQLKRLYQIPVQKYYVVFLEVQKQDGSANKDKTGKAASKWQIS